MRPQQVWDRENSKQIKIKLFTIRDADIISWWDNIPQGKKANTFRRMAEKEMGKSKKNSQIP